jgi:hypothetical protein
MRYGMLGVRVRLQILADVISIAQQGKRLLIIRERKKKTKLRSKMLRRGM